MRTLGLAAAGFVVGAAVASGCGKTTQHDPPPGAVDGGPDPICGSCLKFEEGDDDVSGVSELDGYLRAAHLLGQAVDTIRVQFAGDVRALCSLYGVDASAGVDASVVESLVIAMDAEVGAATANGLSIHYTAPQCWANISGAWSAQARCEIEVGCDGQLSPDEPGVECQGECRGTCDGNCTGPGATCVGRIDNAICSGACTGGCQFPTPAACKGICHGACDAKCDGSCNGTTDASGRCTGTCDGACGGRCTGTCELDPPAACAGKCAGTCATDIAEGSCGAAECHGTCAGTCDGPCTGIAAPSLAGNCDAAQRCQGQAAAQGAAGLECDPPLLDYSYAVNGAASGETQATFLWHQAEVKRRAPGIVRDAVRLALLINGDTARGIPSPLAYIATAVSGHQDADALGKQFDIPRFALPCVPPAFAAASRLLADLQREIAPTLEAQRDVALYLTTGMHLARR